VSDLGYGFTAIFLAAVLAWQLIVGRALGTWWFPNITRQNNPGAYWLVVAVQGAILVAFLMTGKTWHMR
jgi:hypothetical protein